MSTLAPDPLTSSPVVMDNAVIDSAVVGSSASSSTPDEALAAPATGTRQQTLPIDALAPSIAQGRLYALIDGLQQPGLAALAIQQHPKVNTALYQHSIDVQYQQISPHIVRVDQTVYDWLSPVIEQDPHWGWFLLPRARYQHWPFNALLRNLVEHFSISAIAPNREQGESSYFRLHDPRVIQRWLNAASDHALQALFGPLDALLIQEGSQLQHLSLADTQQPEVRLQLPPAPWPPALLAELGQQKKNQQLEQLHTHLRAQHRQVEPWSDETLDQYIIDNGNIAARLGFDTPRLMAQYLSISIELGPDFIDRPDGQWARDILAHTQQQDTSERLQQLAKAACTYLDRTAERNQPEQNRNA